MIVLKSFSFTLKNKTDLGRTVYLWLPAQQHTSTLCLEIHLFISTTMNSCLWLQVEKHWNDVCAVNHRANFNPTSVATAKDSWCCWIQVQPHRHGQQRLIAIKVLLFCLHFMTHFRDNSFLSSQVFHQFRWWETTPALIFERSRTSKYSLHVLRWPSVTGGFCCDDSVRATPLHFSHLSTARWPLTRLSWSENHSPGEEEEDE